MKKRKLGRTDLEVSELCLCTQRLGTLPEEETVFALLDAYHEQGGCFLQNPTRGVDHGADLDDGTTEERVGRWLQTRALQRRDVVLATRLDFLRPQPGGSIAFVNRVRTTCEGSLRRLRTSYLDLLICEWNDPFAPADDLIDALDMLIRAGLVRYAVASGFPPWRVVDSLYRSSLRNRCRFEALQVDGGLPTPAQLERDTFALCREHRLGLLLRMPLGAPAADAPPTAARLSAPRDLDALRQHPQVDSTVISPASVSELRDWTHAGDAARVSAAEPHASSA